jgi:NAD(P)H-nitrite reductase large subunit
MHWPAHIRETFEAAQALAGELAEKVARLEADKAETSEEVEGHLRHLQDRLQVCVCRCVFTQTMHESTLRGCNSTQTVRESTPCGRESTPSVRESTSCGCESTQSVHSLPSVTK